MEQCDRKKIIVLVCGGENLRKFILDIPEDIKNIPMIIADDPLPEIMRIMNFHRICAEEIFEMIDIDKIIPGTRKDRGLKNRRERKSEILKVKSASMKGRKTWNRKR